MPASLTAPPVTRRAASSTSGPHARGCARARSRDRRRRGARHEPRLAQPGARPSSGRCARSRATCAARSPRRPARARALLRRAARQLPAAPGRATLLYVGTGGPGHLDPRRNDGVRARSQGIREDPSWEPGVFGCFDAHRARTPRRAARRLPQLRRDVPLVGRRRRGPARPREGGKSAGILENVLTRGRRARTPGSGSPSQQAGASQRLRVVDNRLFDLIPHADRFPRRSRAIALRDARRGRPGGGASR